MEILWKKKLSKQKHLQSTKSPPCFANDLPMGLTSGAIQKGVPTEVFLLSRVFVSWADTPNERKKHKTNKFYVRLLCKILWMIAECLVCKYLMDGQ